MTGASNPAASFTMEYDFDGRLEKVKKAGVLQTAYTYDPVSAQLTQISDAAGVTALEYDGLGRLWRIDDPFSTANTVRVRCPLEGRAWHLTLIRGGPKNGAQSTG